jgi:hypothetical protein
LIRERVHDPYKTRLKLSDPTICRQCGAVYGGDRWHWGPAPEDANQGLCHACLRINDKIPAGELNLKGRFIGRHKTEILQLIRHQEELEKGEHPLHRIMVIDVGADKGLVTTTDIHLPRRLGEALHNAYEGELDYHYDKGEYFIRVHWRRDE